MKPKETTLEKLSLFLLRFNTLFVLKKPTILVFFLKNQINLNVAKYKYKLFDYRNKYKLLLTPAVSK